MARNQIMTWAEFPRVIVHSASIKTIQPSLACRQRLARKRDWLRSLVRRIRRIQISKYLNNENMRKTYYITIALAFVAIYSSAYSFLSCAPSFFLLLFLASLSTPCLCPCLCQNMTADRSQCSLLGLHIRRVFRRRSTFYASGSFNVVCISGLRRALLLEGKHDCLVLSPKSRLEVSLEDTRCVMHGFVLRDHYAGPLNISCTRNRCIGTRFSMDWCSFLCH